MNFFKNILQKQIEKITKPITEKYDNLKVEFQKFKEEKRIEKIFKKQSEAIKNVEPFLKEAASKVFRPRNRQISLPKPTLPRSTNLRELAQAATYKMNNIEPPAGDQNNGIRALIRKMPTLETRDRTPITLKLHSLVNGADRTFTFQNYYHYEQFLESAAAADSDLNEADSLVYLNSAGQGAFTNCTASVSVAAGGCIRSYRNNLKNIETPHYIFNFKEINSRENNCGLAAISGCENNKINCSFNKIREEFNIAKGSKIIPADLYSIYAKYGPDGKKLKIIDASYAGALNKDDVYILLFKNHYYLVTSFVIVEKEYSFKTKRGDIMFDLETRPMFDKVYYIDCCCKDGHDTNNKKCEARKSFTLGDTILNAVVRRFKSNIKTKLSFVRNDEKTPSRQFLDWLIKESDKGHFYKIGAHNGARFDFYFLVAQLTAHEQATTKLQLRQHSIIGMDYKNHKFFDSCCFMADSLDKLCNDFKLKTKKQTEIKFTKATGEIVEMSSKQLCFYKPELDMKEFLELQHKEPEFWEAYDNYCYYDCLSLYELWTKFVKLSNSLVEKINSKLLKSASVGLSSTIGSHAKKIVHSYLKDKLALSLVDQFFSITKKYRKMEKKKILTETEKEYMQTIEKYAKEKYQFLEKMKTGGISHCNKPGKFTVPVMAVDIASQYPAAMMYMQIPCGESMWIDKFAPKMHGFYYVKDLIFNKNIHAFKPIAERSEISLNWISNFENKETYLDSTMITYLQENHGLENFTVIKGLVSANTMQGRTLFAPFIKTFYTEKRRQDFLKDSNSEEYNAALRAVIKLYLNSLSGKMVEDSSKYFSLEFSGFNEPGKAKIGDVSFQKKYKPSLNTYLICGVMLYAYSKQLLFEYIKCLPNGAADVIHVETDSIYFMLKHKEEFLKNLENYKGNFETKEKYLENLKNYNGAFPCKLGDELGNIKIEKITNDTSYFVGKKLYSLGFDNKSDDQRVKGIPQKTIDAAGNTVHLVDRQLYEDIYQGKSVTKSFYTMRKILFGNTVISSHLMSRTIKGSLQYNLYDK